MKLPVTAIIMMSVLGSAKAFAGASDIYGWDIKCMGADGLSVQARQSDDDFYIDYKSNAIHAVKTWMNSNGQFNSKLKTLLFVTDHEYSDGIQASLVITRDRIVNNSSGTGIISIDGELHSLNCFVRFGVDEEDFDNISSKAFPSISPAAEVY